MRPNFVVLQGQAFNRQKGVVLVVGLVMVLLLAIIALGAIRGSGLQETMAGNMRERNVAFQAAESALRDCEELTLGPSVHNLPVADCLDNAGMCDDLDTTTPSNSVINNDVYWRQKARAIGVVVPDVVSQPTCLVEVLHVDAKGSSASVGGAIGRLGMLKSGSPSPYRVSAQGVGAVQTTSVVTQSTYSRLFK